MKRWKNSQRDAFRKRGMTSKEKSVKFGSSSITGVGMTSPMVIALKKSDIVKEIDRIDKASARKMKREIVTGRNIDHKVSSGREISMTERTKKRRPVKPKFDVLRYNSLTNISKENLASLE